MNPANDAITTRLIDLAKHVVTECLLTRVKQKAAASSIRWKIAVIDLRIDWASAKKRWAARSRRSGH
ncbi:MAG: hypothetical protein AB9M53_02455 [Leptothrix sp. (in: b-proteobacteria)]